MPNDVAAQTAPATETAAPKRAYFLPTRAYSIIDAINRAAAATGSIQYAMQAGNADYNGHHVTVYFNDYKGYWLAEHCWAGRCVHSRGSLENALKAAKAEYDRGAKGASVKTQPLTDEEGALALALGYQVWTEEAEKAVDATWRDGRYNEVVDAMMWERAGVPALLYLRQSKTVEEYKARANLCCAENALVRARKSWLEEARAKAPDKAELARLETYGKKLAAEVAALKAQLGVA